MKTQILQQTFENVAAFKSDVTKIKRDPQEAIQALTWETHYQLCATLSKVLSRDYNLREEVFVRIDPETMQNEAVEMDIVRASDTVSVYEHTDIARRLGSFMEDLKPFAVGRAVMPLLTTGNILGSLQYEPKDLNDTFWEMVTQKYPRNADAMAHLNTLTHLIERIDHYKPACQMN